jgi:Fe-S-cluster containining protein
MTTPTTNPWGDTPVQAWHAAARDPLVSSEYELILDELARATRERQPICHSSGRCCRFEEFGHRLYVTGLETAWTIGHLPPGVRFDRPGLDAAIARGGCPFQLERLCSVHLVRPLGCRVYFCDETAQEWQRDLYESLLRDLRNLHDRHQIPYEYAEWRAMLARLLGEDGARPIG